jgi:RNA ligase (TIGR02306 family)
MDKISTIVAEEKSTHWVDVFKMPPLEKHPDPEVNSLSIIKIPETEFTYVAKTADWIDKIGKLVFWLQPETVFPVERPEFASYVDLKGRVKAKKLRGVISYGILVLAPDNCNLQPGDNASEFLGCSHWDPNESPKHGNNKGFKLPSGEVASPPQGVYPKYDVDSMLRYSKCFTPGEEVYLTEKLEGENMRVTFVDGVMHCGSRNEWKREFTQAPNISLETLTEKVGGVKAKEIFTKTVTNFRPQKSKWWDVMDRTPTLRPFCEAHPGWCVYGEHYGKTGKFTYDTVDGKSKFRAFDILVPATETAPARWLDADEFIETCDKFGIPRVPLLAKMPFDLAKLLEMAEMNSTIGNHIAEGIVVVPSKERWDKRLGRLKTKIVNSAYLAMK